MPDAPNLRSGMPVQSSRHVDSIGVVIVLAFMGGCLALLGAVADAGFADGGVDGPGVPRDVGL